MKKFKIFLITLSAFAILFAGSSVAYYNTKSFGFDEDAIFFQRNKDGIIFLDKEIKYKDIEYIIESAEPYVPDEICVTKPYIGVHTRVIQYIMCI